MRSSASSGCARAVLIRSGTLSGGSLVTSRVAITSGSPQAFSSGVRFEFVGKGPAVAFENDEGGSEDCAVFLQQPNECLVDRFVSHAMNEQVGVLLDRGPRRLQFGRVDRDPQVAGVTSWMTAFTTGRKSAARSASLCRRGSARRRGRGGRRNDVPDFDVIGFLLREFANEGAPLLRRIDLHDRRIAEVELRARHARNERAGHRHPGRLEESHPRFCAPRNSTSARPHRSRS